MLNCDQFVIQKKNISFSSWCLYCTCFLPFSLTKEEFVCVHLNLSIQKKKKKRKKMQDDNKEKKDKKKNSLEKRTTEKQVKTCEIPVVRDTKNYGFRIATTNQDIFFLFLIRFFFITLRIEELIRRKKTINLHQENEE